MDNVLVNMTTGEVAHIDYNICFERGQNLRVPERVPFRLTQNLENALGLTRAEGVFRVSCETAMNILRAQSDVLLTLLEAFVDDPLLDWQAGSDAGIIASFYGGGTSSKPTSAQKNPKESRKNLEKSLCYRLYAIRLVEMRAQSVENRSSLVESLSRLLQIAAQVCELIEKVNHKEAQIRLHEQSKIYLDESLTLHGEISSKTKSPQLHSVYSLHERYGKFLQFTAGLDKIRTLLDEKIDVFEKLSKSHSDAILFIKS